MKKTIIAVPFLAVLIVTSLILLKQTANLDERESILALDKEVSFLTLAGDSLIFNSKNFPGKLILNFYGTECGLCRAEVNDIVTFSRDYNIDVLFVTADSLPAIRAFEREVQTKGFGVARVRFAQIKLLDAKRLFGDLIVPQSVALSRGLVIKGHKKGLVSYSFLRKSFI
jgi:hypothetical protein